MKNITILLALIFCVGCNYPEKKSELVTIKTENDSLKLLLSKCKIENDSLKLLSSKTEIDSIDFQSLSDSSKSLVFNSCNWRITDIVSYYDVIDKYVNYLPTQSEEESIISIIKKLADVYDKKEEKIDLKIIEKLILKNEKKSFKNEIFLSSVEKYCKSNRNTAEVKKAILWFNNQDAFFGDEDLIWSYHMVECLRDIIIFNSKPTTKITLTGNYGSMSSPIKAEITLNSTENKEDKIQFIIQNLLIEKDKISIIEGNSQTCFKSGDKIPKKILKVL